MASGKTRLKQHFIDHVGEVLTSKQLAEIASPVTSWARRVRELREQEGWPIVTHHDVADLKPGQYRLEYVPHESAPREFRRGISQRVRAEVLDRDGHTCQMCGKGAGEYDEDTGRPVRLHLGHIIDKSRGGTDDPGNLRALCSVCNQGAKNVTLEKPTRLWLLAQIRRANIDDQRAVYEWLTKRFEGKGEQQLTLD